jgi:hypothetical protein
VVVVAFAASTGGKPPLEVCHMRQVATAARNHARGYHCHTAALVGL